MYDLFSGDNNVQKDKKNYKKNRKQDNSLVDEGGCLNNTRFSIINNKGPDNSFFL